LTGVVINGHQLVQQNHTRCLGVSKGYIQGILAAGITDWGKYGYIGIFAYEPVAKRYIRPIPFLLMPHLGIKIDLDNIPL
jgi:hypothetical protein